MYRAAARRVCRCHGMDRDEAQRPPPRCRLPHRAIATGVGWLRSFWFSTPAARAPGVSSAAPRSSAMRTWCPDSSSRLWRPARSLGTHAKQSPSTGHSAVGLRQAGNSLLTPRPHFTAPSCTLGNQVVGASDGASFRQERRPTRICRTPGAGSGLLAEASAPVPPHKQRKRLGRWTIWNPTTASYSVGMIPRRSP